MELQDSTPAQSVERATPVEEVLGLISAVIDPTQVKNRESVNFFSIFLIVFFPWGLPLLSELTRQGMVKSRSYLSPSKQYQFNEFATNHTI